MIDFDNETPHELISGFPERHHWTFRCILYLWVYRGIEFRHLKTVLARMGFEYVDVREEHDGISLGAPTYACPDDLVPG